MARTFSTATTFQEAAQQGLIGLAAGELASGISVDAVTASLLVIAPNLGEGNALSVVEQAIAFRAGGLVFSTAASGEKPTMAEIPTDPFLAPTTVRIEVVAEIDMPSINKTTRAVLGCTFGFIPDNADIADCVNAAVDNWMSNFYPGVRGFTFDFHISGAERGKFFGK